MFVDDADLDAGQRPSDRAGSAPAGEHIAHAFDRDAAERLGLAIGLQYRYTEPRLEFLAQRGSQRRGARGHVAHRAQLLPDGHLVQQHPQHGRIKGEIVDTELVHQSLGQRAAELPQQHHVAADIQREEQAHHARGVGKGVGDQVRRLGHRRQRAGIGVGPERRNRRAKVRPRVVVSQHNTFRRTRGTRSEQNQGGLIAGNIGYRQRLRPVDTLVGQPCKWHYGESEMAQVVRLARVHHRRAGIHRGRHAVCVTVRYAGMHRDDGRTDRPPGRQHRQEPLVVADAAQHPVAARHTRSRQLAGKPCRSGRELAECPRRLVFDEQERVFGRLGVAPGQKNRERTPSDSSCKVIRARA